MLSSRPHPASGALRAFLDDAFDDAELLERGTGAALRRRRGRSPLTVGESVDGKGRRGAPHFCYDNGGQQPVSDCSAVDCRQGEDPRRPFGAAR